MKVAVPRETVPGERRVALVPDAVARLIKLGLEVLVEEGAGAEAFLSNPAYVASGARLLPDAASLLAEADIVLKVQKPDLEEAERLREGSALVSFLQPHASLELVRRLAERRITSFSMEAVPRITRAQSMDALSSMRTITGYKAVLAAAAAQAKIFPMLTTAAGTLPPARVLILGAGVAGLQAIATARRLGAVVAAFDVRPSAKEHVESLGASFIQADLGSESTEGAQGYAKELSRDAQAGALDAIRRHLKDVDAVIATALIPGKPAPVLITEDMVREMRPGSVIVDAAAEAGGNCALTEPGKDVVRHQVTILGPLNLPATVPLHASQMYSRNLTALLGHLVKDGALRVDLEDAVTREMCVTHGGRVVHEATARLLEPVPEGAGT